MGQATPGVGIATSIAGGLYSAMAQHQAGKDAQATADWNAAVADMQARDAVERGAADEQRFRVQARGVTGAQRSSIAGQGVDLDSDTALAIQEDSRRAIEQDAMTIRNNAAREALGLRTQATAMRLDGASARRQGTMQAIGTLLTSGAAATSAGYRAGA